MSTDNLETERQPDKNIMYTSKESILEALRAVSSSHKLAAKDYYAVYENLNWQSIKEQEEELYGVIIEIGNANGGYDLLNVYANYCASLMSCDGAFIIWERPDGEFDALIDEVLEAGKILLPNMPKWDKAYCQVVPIEHTRIHVLGSHGMYSSEALTKEMYISPLGQEVMQYAQQLMKWLMYYHEQGMHLD